MPGQTDNLIDITGVTISTTVDNTSPISVYIDPSKFLKSAFGELLVTRNIPHVGWRFDYGVITKLVTTTTSNGGAQ